MAPSRGFLVALIVVALVSAVAPDSLTGEWQLVSSHKRETDPLTKQIEVDVVACRTNTRECLPGVLPGTVLEALLHNDTFGLARPSERTKATPDDVYYEQNLRSVPDIQDTGREFYAFTYELALTLPRMLGEEAHPPVLHWLHFDGINYRADVALAGEEAFGTMASAMRRHRFQLPVPATHDPNAPIPLRIQVEPPDEPGRADGCQGGDHAIAANAAVPQFVAGWDWVQATPDRDTGIWDALRLRRTSCLVFTETHLETTSILFANGARLRQHTGGMARDGRGAASEDVAGTEHPTHAELRYETTLENHCATTQTGKLVVELRLTSEAADAEDPVARLEVHVVVEGSDQIRISEILLLAAPRLWWPHTHGEPFLYDVRSQVLMLRDDEADHISDEARMKHGVRVIEAYRVPSSLRSGMGFRVNGIRIFLQGGNWIASDQMLRHSRARYWNEVQRHRDANLNLLRVWGGGIAERDGFFEATDALGVLVMQDFFMTGDANGRWGGSYAYPLEADLYLEAVRDTVMALRTHASLLFWCGGNELGPEGVSPPAGIAAGLEETLARYDPFRFFIQSSMYDPRVPDPPAVALERRAPEVAAGAQAPSVYALAPKDGPYGFLLACEFWEANPGLAKVSLAYAAGPVPFQPEVGSAAMPTFRALQAFMKESSWRTFPRSCTEGPWEEPTWTFHKFQPFCTEDANYDHIYAFGPMPDTATYAFAAQLAQKAQYQALFEGFRSRALAPRTAVLLWKSQSPWPALRGFLYDHDRLAPTGGFYGVRQGLAMASGVHVQLRWPSRDGPGEIGCENGWCVDVVALPRSDSPTMPWNVGISAQVFDLQGQLLAEVEISDPVRIERAGATRTSVRLPWVPCDADAAAANSASGAVADLVCGVRLYRLRGGSHPGLVASNEYWLGPPDALAPDFAAIGLVRSSMPPARVTATATMRESREAGTDFIAVELRLPEDAPVVAFGVVVEVLCELGGRNSAALPLVPSDGYFFVLPGETRILSIPVPDGVRSTSTWGWARTEDAPMVESERSCAMLETWRVHVAGWNVRETTVPLRLSGARAEEA